MAWRNLHRELPYFFSYAAFQVLESVLRWLVYRGGNYEQYFWTFMVTQAISVGLGFMVISEVLQYVFRTYEALKQLGLVLFHWVALVLVAVAVLSAAAAPGADHNRIMAGIFVLGRSVQVVQVGLLLFLFLLSSFFGFSWKEYVFGVAAGFGVLGSIQLAAFSIRAKLGFHSAGTFELLLGVGETCAALIWTFYFLTPARQLHPRI